MVRRRAVITGLANHITSKAYQHFQQQQMAQLNTGWLGWPQQPIRREAIVSNMCNKMVGSLPRMPKLRQPEPSSRNLGRLRRDLMNISPLPFPNSAQKARPEVVAAVPMWYANGKMMVSDSTRLGSPNREMESISSISVQLKQELQELSDQYREQQMQHQLRQKQQQLKLHQKQLKLQQLLLRERQLELQQQKQRKQPKLQHQKFLPFNFGICAGSLLNGLHEQPAAGQFSDTDIVECAKQDKQLSRPKSPDSEDMSASSAASLSCSAASPNSDKVKGHKRLPTASRSAMETAARSLAALYLPEEESDDQAAKLKPGKSETTLLERTSGYCARPSSAMNLARSESSGLNNTLVPSTFLTRQSLVTLRDVALKTGNQNLERQLKLTLDHIEVLHQLLQQELAANDEANSKKVSDSQLQKVSAGEVERLKAGHSDDDLSAIVPKAPKPLARKRLQWKMVKRKTLVPVDGQAVKRSKRNRSVKVVSCIELSSRRPLQWPVPRFLSGWTQLLPQLEKKAEKKAEKKKQLTIVHHCRRRRNQHGILVRVPSEKCPSVHRSRTGCRCRTNGMLGTSPLACNYYRSRYRYAERPRFWEQSLATSGIQSGCRSG